MGFRDTLATSDGDIFDDGEWGSRRKQETS
jgi:hypothetical protein